MKCLKVIKASSSAAQHNVRASRASFSVVAAAGDGDLISYQLIGVRRENADISTRSKMVFAERIRPISAECAPNDTVLLCYSSEVTHN